MILAPRKPRDWWIPLFVAYTWLIIKAERIQISLGQPVSDAKIDTAFLTCVVFLANDMALTGWLFLAVVAFVVIETYSYIYTCKTLTVSFLAIMNPFYAMTDHPEFILEGGLIFVLALAIVFIPRALLVHVKGPRIRASTFLALNITVWVGFLFTVKVAHGLFPFSRAVFLNTGGEMRRLDDYFNKKAKSHMRAGMKKKNLIYILAESMERQFLGTYNQFGRPNTMPFLTGAANRSLFVNNLDVTDGTEWSAAAMVATQCGVPMVLPIDRSEIRDRPMGVARGRFVAGGKSASHMNCLGDFLADLGYTNIALYVGDTGFDGIGNLLTSHGFSKLYSRPQGLTSDRYLMEQFNVTLAERVGEWKEKGTPFTILLGLEDTHPRFKADCKARTEIAGPSRGGQAFDCLDQRIETIIKMIHKKGLTPENTEVMIHGDHTVLGSFPEFIGTKDRKMFVVFPFQNRTTVEKQGYLYDIVPTLFDVMGIDFEPSFPYGQSIFSRNVTSPPKPKDFSYIATKLGTTAV